MDAAIFHEHYAADLGVLEAIETLAHLYLDMDRDIFLNYHIEVGGEFLCQLLWINF